MSLTRAPGSVITAAVFMFCYGALLLLCGVCGGVGLAVQPQNDAMGVLNALEKEAPGHMIVSYAGVGANILFGILFLVCGAGVLRLVPIFRTLSYVVCAGIFLVTVSSAVYNAIFVFPIQQRLIMEQMRNPNQPPMPFDMGMLMKGSMALGLLIAIGIPLVFCLPTIICLSVKSARDAFAGNFPEDDDPYAGRRRPRDDDGYDDGDHDDDYPRSKSPRSPGDTGITDRGQ